MAASYFLLLAQKKVTKEKGTLGAAPSPAARVRYGRTGSAHRPSWPESRIGAIPRAARVRGTRLLRPPFAAALEGTRKSKSKAKVKVDSGFRRNDVGGVSDICGASASAAGTAALCSSRAPLGRGEQAEEKPEGARAWMRARSTSAHGRAVGEPRSLLA